MIIMLRALQNNGYYRRKTPVQNFCNHRNVVSQKKKVDVTFQERRNIPNDARVSKCKGSLYMFQKPGCIQNKTKAPI